MMFSTERTTLFIIILITVLTQMAIALYLPVLPNIAQALHASPNALKLSIALYLLGSALSQLIFGPLSDIFGRKYPLLIGLSIFSIGCIIAASTQNITILLVSRLIQGFGAGSGLTLGRGIIKDTFEGTRLATAMAYLSMAFAVGFGFSPLIGSFVQKHINWHADFVILTFYSILLILIVGALYKPKPHLIDKTKAVSYANIYKNKCFIKYTLAGMLAYSIIITYSTLTPFLIEKTWHFSPLLYSLLTLCVGLAYFIGAYINKLLVSRLGISKIINYGIALLSGCGSTIGIFHSNIMSSEFIVIACLIISGATQGLIFSNTMAGALANFKETVGVASGLLSFSQIMFSAIIVSLLSFLPDYNALSISIVYLALSFFLFLIVNFT